MDVKERMKQLDWNRDGKIDLADAQDFLEEQLAREQFKTLAIGFAIGIAFTMLLVAIFS